MRRLIKLLIFALFVFTVAWVDFGGRSLVGHLIDIARSETVAERGHVIGESLGAWFERPEADIPQVEELTLGEGDIPEEDRAALRALIEDANGDP